MPNIPPHKSFTTRYKPITRVLFTDVHIGPAFDLRKADHPEFKKVFKAIWDTGATGTVISKRVVAECGFHPITFRKVHTAGGITTSGVYLISVLLPNTHGFARVEATEGILSEPFDVLIGMDIISKGDLAVTNANNETVPTFRFPSYGKIDFVTQPPPKQEPIKSEHPKIGRNAPCICGSGKKYKKCCGGNLRKDTDKA